MNQIKIYLLDSPESMANRQNLCRFSNLYHRFLRDFTLAIKKTNQKKYNKILCIFCES
ncbi:hypothetical protein [Helicobacter sp. 23-1045]